LKKKILLLINKSKFLLSFVWVSDSYTKFFIELTNSLNDWSTLLWFYITSSHLFTGRGCEWSWHITLVFQEKFLLGQVANYSKMILAYLKFWSFLDFFFFLVSARVLFFYKKRTLLFSYYIKVCIKPYIKKSSCLDS